MRWRWMPAPRAASILLDRLFEVEEGSRNLKWDREFPLSVHQEEAVLRARSVLGRRGGVLIADTVGLGKTYVALALIQEELDRGGNVVVAIPASLREVWDRPLRRLMRRAGGDLAGAGVTLVTHARLGRGTGPEPGATRGLVVVDEAHRFRNPRTRRYAALAELCQGAGVVLLSATPINNGLADLYHLLRLYAADDAFRDRGVASLAAAFTGDGRSAVPAEVRRVVGAAMIRRTRDALRAGPAAGMVAPGRRAPLTFPRRATPRVVRYEDHLLTELTALVTALELPGYALPRAAGASTSTDVAALVRLGLLKRLDSSRAAFGASIRGHERFARSFLDTLAGGRLLRPRDRPGAAPGGDGDPDQLFMTDVLVAEAPPEMDLRRLAAGATADLGRFERMRHLLEREPGPDPKTEALADLCRRLRDERLLVFTEYRDTAAHLWRRLAREFRVARVEGDGAWLGARPAGRAAVIERFAPAASGRPAPPDRERVDVLVATDVLSEGMNLQAARHVVSYDLPWNPVRLLQRIGRVDRLGSPHRSVVPYLFVPAGGIDATLGLRRALRAKFGDMEGALGSESADRVLARMVAGGRTAAAALTGSTDGVVDEVTSPVERLRALRRRAAPAPVMAEVRCPVGLVAGNPEDGAVRAVVLADSGGTRWLLEWPADEDEVRDISDAGVGLVIRALDSGAGASDPPRAGQPPAPALSRLERAVADHLGAVRAAAAAPPSLRAGSAMARIAAGLRAAIAADAAAPPELLARADRVLERLGRPVRPAIQAELERRLSGRSRRHASLAAWLAALEPALCSPEATPSAGCVVARPGPSAHTPEIAARPRLRAVLLVSETARKRPQSPPPDG